MVEPTERRSPTLGWAGLGLLATIWVVAHWRLASFLDRLDRRWDPPSWIEPIEQLFLVVVGVVSSILLVAGVQWLFRRTLARQLAGVEPRRQVLVFVVPVLVCLLASWRFQVMLVGPLLLLALNVVQFARGLPPSTPATEAFGWFGRTGARVGKASWRLAGRGAQAARDRRAAAAAREQAADDAPPPF